MVLSVAPIIAPTLGSWMLLLAGWRAIYGFLGVSGLALLALVVVGLAETRPVPRNNRGVLRGYALMVGHRSAMAYAAVNALSFGALFAYVSGSPLVLMAGLGLSAPFYGLLFAITSGGIMAGAWVNGQLSRYGVPPRLPLALALSVSLVTAIGLVLVTGRGAGTLAALMPLLVVHMFCRGVIAPSASHATLEPMGEIAGLASAVLGFLQMASGALSSAAVALLFPAFGPVSMALVMALCALGALVAWRIARPSSAAPALAHPE